MAKIRYRKVYTPVRERTAEIYRDEDKLYQILRNIKYKNHALIPVANFLEPTPVKEKLGNHIATDGKRIFFSGGQLFDINGYGTCRSNNASFIEAQILHIIMHGFLGHFGRREVYEHRGLIWKVMDIQVMKMLNLIYGSHGEVQKFLEDDIAFALYYRAIKHKEVVHKIDSIISSYRNELDDHSSWALPDAPGIEAAVNPAGGKPGDEIRKFWNEQSSFLAGCLTGSSAGADPQGWKMLTRITEKLKQSLNGYGSEEGSDHERMTPADGEAKLTYRELLRDLSKYKEKVWEEDSIDPIYYTYGLLLYGDVPIVESSEISEQPNLGTVVIALDTSGSCRETLPRFLLETKEVFGEVLKYGKMGNMFLLQCDTMIQEERRIRDPGDLSELEGGLELKGFGGTSFVPVFQWIEEYQNKEEDIECLIYFTDGYGSYPDKEPSYPVYFVLSEEINSDFIKIPSWIKCLEL